MDKEKVLYWFPRVLTIAYILFLSLFVLDVFGKYSFPMIIVALFMHLIPSFVLIALLVVAWKWEMIGGILFIIAGAVFIVWFGLYENFITFLMIGLPLLIVGIMFLVNSYKLKK